MPSVPDSGSSSAGTWLRNSLWANIGRSDDDEAGAAGVREPRRPIQPLNSSGAALDVPLATDAACSTDQARA